MLIKEVKINSCENKDFCYIILKIVFIIFIKIYWIFLIKGDINYLDYIFVKFILNK